jgi:mRNA-degrading endonuclease RelE of RelBE toxin-antitoxin system
MPYKIGFSDLGKASLKAVDKKVRQEICRSMLPLSGQPKSGKPLIGPFLGLYSLRVGNRYRVIYRIEEETERIYVELIGERKPGREEDVYRVAQRLLEHLKD